MIASAPHGSPCPALVEEVARINDLHKRTGGLERWRSAEEERFKRVDGAERNIEKLYDKWNDVDRRLVALSSTVKIVGVVTASVPSPA